jgi:hypothetical protein
MKRKWHCRLCGKAFNLIHDIVKHRKATHTAKLSNHETVIASNLLEILKREFLALAGWRCSPEMADVVIRLFAIREHGTTGS